MIRLLLLAALLGAGQAWAQQQPDVQFNQYALQILKQQRDQAMDQIVTLGAQLAQARDEIQQLKARKDDTGSKDH